MPLTLSVRIGQAIRIGEVATVTVEDKSGQMVRLAIDADKAVRISRIDGPAPRGSSWGITGKLEGPASGK